MARTMADAAAKFDRKADAMGARWEARKPNMKTNWPEGIHTFYGARPGPISTGSFNAGIDAISATDFANRVRGKGSKMMERAKAGLML